MKMSEIKSYSVKIHITYENSFTYSSEEYMAYCKEYELEPSQEDFKIWVHESVMDDLRSFGNFNNFGVQYSEID